MSDKLSDAEHQRKAARAAARTCITCGRTFSRTEHLQRHLRIHTQEKPFECPQCHQRFPRIDVQVRHLNHFCSKGSLQSSASQSSSRKRNRVACDFCHSKKQKCSGVVPCMVCSTKGITCTIEREALAAPNQREEDNISISPKPVYTTPTSPEAEPSNSTKSAQEVAHGNFIASPENVSQGFHQPYIGQITNNALTLSGDEHLSGVSPRSVPMLQGDFSLRTPGIEADNYETGFTPGSSTVLNSIIASSTTSNTNRQNHTFQLECEQPLGSRQDLWLQNASSNLLQGGSDLSNLWFTDYDFMFSDTIPYLEDPSTVDMQAAAADPAYQTVLGPALVHDEIMSVLDIVHQNCSLRSGDASPRSQQANSQWLLNPPSPTRYDAEIINSFLNMFVAHVAPQFTTFHGFRVRKETLPELTLATAAVGGLFCTVPGSFIVARAMYSDARRVLLTLPRSTDISDDVKRVAVVQTYIALELFGICCGDQRFYELSEAFHMQLLQVLHEYGFLSSNALRSNQKEETRRHLVSSIFILESYRVILFQRPPNLYPTATPDLILPLETVSDIDAVYRQSEPRNLLQVLQSLLTMDVPAEKISSPTHSAYTLAALSSMSWYAISASPAYTLAGNPWRSDGFYLALNRWANAHESQVSPSTMLLYHVNSVVLHANMAHVRALARSHLKKSAGLDEVIKAAIRGWTRTNACAISTWHACEITKIAKGWGSYGRPHDSHKTSTQVKDNIASGIEAPHTAICIYLAYLTLWANSASSPTWNVEDAHDLLGSGILLLGSLKVRVAAVLKDVLMRLCV